MPSKDELTHERRAQILQAAALVFARSGVDGARMDDIVAESGLSKGTLYWYFSSKQDIVVALVEEVIRAQYEQLQMLVEHPGGVVERLGIFLDTYAALMGAQPSLGPLGVEIYAMSGRVPQIREFITHYYDQYIATLAELLQQGNDRGELRVERPKELALNFACLIEGVTLFWAVDSGRVDLGRQFRSALNDLFRGIVIQVGPRD